MSPEPHNSVEVFYSYAHEDEKLRDELKKHLANLKRQDVITDWYDANKSGGKERNEEIEPPLNSAKIILLLISPDFMNSDYINDVEVKRAMARHEAGEARVIPLILRPCDWPSTWTKLQALPKDGKPVTSWDDQDEAFLNIVKGIRRVAEDLRRNKIVRTRTFGAPKTNPHFRVPDPLTDFVPRLDSFGNDIVKLLQVQLKRPVLVVLWGKGGVGKTAIAAETARTLAN